MQPYTSLADILLDGEETDSKFRIAKNWFDQFRVATDGVDSKTLQQAAMRSKCTILSGNFCYGEDGSVREVCHKLSVNALKTFYEDFKKCANVCAEMIVAQRLKYKLDELMAKQNTTLANLEAKQSELTFKIR